MNYNFFNYIVSDWKFYSKAKKSRLKPLLDITFFAVIIFRISQFISIIRIPLFPKLFWLVNRILFSIDIDPRANLGPGFRIVHGIGLVIGHQVISEGNLTVYQGVTLGGNNWHTTYYNGQKILQPFIGFNVTIYTNSIIVGPVVIKNDTVVSAGSKIFA
jgi:serine O-acetyltransferase